MSIRVVMLGDVVGRPGVLAVMQQAPLIRQRYRADLVIVNGENASNGSGLTPDLYNKIIAAGVDGVTLGDHCFRKDHIYATLETQDNIIRPANLPAKAKGKGWMKLTTKSVTTGHVAAGTNVYVITVLGRIFMNMPADDPFATVERILAQLPEKDPIVIVEIHAEATGEKIAMSWHLDGKVSAVIGTHTHVPTADERIMPKGTAAICDIGMCGPHESVIGRRYDAVVTHMTTSMPTSFDVAEGDPRVNGVLLEIDEKSRRSTHIERFMIKADITAPPFAAARAGQATA